MTIDVGPHGSTAVKLTGDLGSLTNAGECTGVNAIDTKAIELGAP